MSIKNYFRKMLGFGLFISAIVPMSGSVAAESSLVQGSGNGSQVQENAYSYLEGHRHRPNLSVAEPVYSTGPLSEDRLSGLGIDSGIFFKDYPTLRYHGCKDTEDRECKKTCLHYFDPGSSSPVMRPLCILYREGKEHDIPSVVSNSSGPIYKVNYAEKIVKKGDWLNKFSVEGIDAKTGIKKQLGYNFGNLDVDGVHRVTVVEKDQSKEDGGVKKEYEWTGKYKDQTMLPLSQGVEKAYYNGCTEEEEKNPYYGIYEGKIKPRACFMTDWTIVKEDKEGKAISMRHLQEWRQAFVGKPEDLAKDSPLHSIQTPYDQIPSGIKVNS